MDIQTLLQDPAYAETIKQITQKVTEEVLKASTATGSTMNTVHGTGSFLGSVATAIEPDVISAKMHWMGLGDVIPTNPTRNREVLLPFITGVEPTSSTEPTTECANCISGETEACIQHFPMGKVCRQTQTMTMERIIERLNRGDIDLNLLNDELGSDSPWHPGASYASLGQQGLMQIATAWALLFELPPLFMHALSPMVYAGNPVNNQGDGYREFRGLDLLVNTGFVDAIANVTCPALDSDVKDFNYGDVKTQQTPSFFEMLEMVHYYVRHNAQRQRLTPVEWVVTMRPELWQIVSSLIPVQSILAAIMNMSIPTNYSMNIDGQTIVNEREKFRRDKVIPLNGEMVKVVVDDGIAELNNANDANLDPGEYASDVYLLPVKYLGGRDAMRIDFKDYRFIAGEIAATNDLLGGLHSWSPDGRFSWTWVKDGPCFLLRANIEPRMILKTPQLAGRIQNVKYVPLQHLRSPDPDSSYFYKGGVSTRSPTSYYY